MKKFLLVILILIIFLNFAENSECVNDKWFSKDKFNHLTSSTFLYCWNYGVSKNFTNLSKNNSRVISISLTELIGITKEFVDSKQKGNIFSYKDVLYNTLGVLLGIVICE